MTRESLWRKKTTRGAGVPESAQQRQDVGWDEHPAVCEERGLGMEHAGGRAGAGAVGSAGSLGLRVGQAVFSSVSLLFMSVGVEFFSYTAFCFLVTIMGLVIPWSCTLAMIDVYSIFMGCPLSVPGVVVIVVVGDCVLSILSFAAACSSAVVIDLLLQFHGSHFSPRFCGRYQLSAMMAFLSWFLTAASALFNFWFLASR